MKHLLGKKHYGLGKRLNTTMTKKHLKIRIRTF